MLLMCLVLKRLVSIPAKMAHNVLEQNFFVITTKTVTVERTRILRIAKTNVCLLKQNCQVLSPVMVTVV